MAEETEQIKWHAKKDAMPKLQTISEGDGRQRYYGLYKRRIDLKKLCRCRQRKMGFFLVKEPLRFFQTDLVFFVH